MARITINFHGLPTEAIDLVGQWIDTHDLHAVAMGFFPGFRVDPIANAADFHQHVESLGIPRRVCLSLQPPDINVTSPLEFMKRNSSSLVIELGAFTDGRLVESVFSVNTENTAELKVWRALASDLRNRTSAGLWGLNPKTGSRHYYKQNRYTARVADEVRRGLQLAPIAGWNLFFIEEPTQSAAQGE